MNRLEIAARMLPVFAAQESEMSAVEAVGHALRWADALIAAELATRPPCEHPGIKITRRYFYNAERKYCHANVCECGAEIT